MWALRTENTEVGEKGAEGTDVAVVRISWAPEAEV